MAAWYVVFVFSLRLWRGEGLGSELTWFCTTQIEEIALYNLCMAFDILIHVSYRGEIDTDTDRRGGLEGTCSLSFFFSSLLIPLRFLFVTIP